MAATALAGRMLSSGPKGGTGRRDSARHTTDRCQRENGPSRRPPGIAANRRIRGWSRLPVSRPKARPVSATELARRQ
jgi:hypothetical protein